MPNTNFQIIGQIINRQTHKGISNLHIEAWDKDVLCNDFVGKATTDANGTFIIEFTATHFQECFLDREPDLFFKIFQNNKLIHSTENSVLWNINSGQTAITIELDVKPMEEKSTLATTNEKTFIVKGQVSQANGLPIPGIITRAFDRDLRSEQLLGEVKTDSDGHYEIVYTADQFTRAEKNRADLIVRVIDENDKVIASSSTVFNAEPEQTINLTLQPSEYRGLSEYEHRLLELNPLIEKIALAELTDDDLNFLHGETGILLEHLDFIRLDSQWSKYYKIEPAVFFGLFRDGLSTNIYQLLAEKPSRWREALKSALEENLIPAAIAGQLEKIIDQLSTLATELAFQSKSEDDTNAPLGAVLATSTLAPEIQKQIVTFALQYEGEEDIWHALQTQGGLEAQTLSAVRFTLESDALLFNHLPTLKAVQKIKEQQKWQEAGNLAQLKPEDWQQIAFEATAQGLPQGFDNAKAYAEAVAHRVEQAFPTAVFRHRLTDAGNPAENDIAVFLAANPNFDLLHTPVDAFLDNGADLGQVQNPTALRGKLKAFSRVARLTPDCDRYPLTQGLLGAGYDSAQKIAAAGKAEFLGRIAPIAGDTLAKNLHETAKARVDAANMHLLRIRDYLFPPTAVLPSANPSGELATWSRLFGSLNTCECRHCRSVNSPAAYLVDVLEFLRKVCLRKNERGECEQNLCDILFQRRPDLGTLLLNCDNANTPIPYIDRVNEILELAVAQVEPTDWPAYQTEGATELDKARLRAKPAHRHDAAYARIGAAVFPWCLPFDQNMERIHAFAPRIGVPLFEVQALFGKAPVEVAKTHLHIGERLHSLMTVASTEAAQLLQVWGIPSAQVADVHSLEDLERVPVLMRQAELGYDELAELLTLRFFGEFEIFIDRGSQPCDYQTHRLSGINPANRLSLFDKLHRFLRLQRTLDWASEKLDAVLATLEHTDIDADTPPLFSTLIRLAAQLRQPEENIARIHSFDTMASVLRVPAIELRLVSRLSGTDPFLEFSSPGTPPISSAERIARLTRLHNHYEGLRTARIDPAELAYLLRDEDLVPAVYAPAEEMLNNRLDQLLAAALANAAAPFGNRPQATDPETLAFSASLATTLTEEQRREAIAAFLDSRIDAYEQHHHQLELALYQHLGSNLGLDAGLVQKLLGNEAPDDNGTITAGILRSIHSSDRSAIADFTSLLRIPLPEEEHSLRNLARRMLIRLAKTARLVQLLDLSLREIEMTDQLPEAVALLDFNRLPVSLPLPGEPAEPTAAEYSGLEAWLRIKRLQAKMPAGDRDIFDLLAAANRATILEEFLELLRTTTDWDRDLKTGTANNAIEIFRDGLGIATMDQFRQLDTYEKLLQAVSWARANRIAPPDLKTLGTDTAANVAHTLETIAEAQYGEDRLSAYTALTPAGNHLRSRRRDALAAFLLANPLLTERVDAGGVVLRQPAWRDMNGLYAHFLIDMEMSACQLTSRIVQAHNAVQLFVQRCLMNLEPGVALGHTADSDHWQQWEWMKNYRVWEAGRKVFLHPENWIEPELRDNKSPFFVELENELLQDDITRESVERAYRHYFAKLDQVARLDVRGLYHEEEHRVLHVFGRTQSGPPQHYYRRQNLHTQVWTAWEKIDLNIESDHLLPVMHDGRLILFWPVFEPEGEVRTTDGSETAVWKLTFAWSEYQYGKWQAGQTGLNEPLLTQYAAKDSFTFKIFAERGQLYIRVYQKRRLADVEQGVTDVVYSIMSLRFDPCTRRLTNAPADRLLFYLNPVRTELSGMAFMESKDAAPRRRINVGSPDEREATPLYALTRAEPDTVIGLILAPTDVVGPWIQLVANRRDVPLLTATPGGFKLLPAHQNRQFTGLHPFFVDLAGPTYLVHPYEVSSGFLGLFPFSYPMYRFDIFYHPFVCRMLHILNREGLGALFTGSQEQPGTWPSRQRAREARPVFRSFGPSVHVAARHYPIEEVDFSFAGAYSTYNWELFFHIPLLVADRLSKNQHFKEAQRWFHYIFNPTDVSAHGSPEKFWQIKPFFEEARRWSGPAETLEEMLRRLASGAADVERQVESWRNDPFNPHLIARLRLPSYMKTVVQKYLQNLLDWGDNLFRRDTLESINEATQLYLLAAEILGPRPVTIQRQEGALRSYNEIREHLDDFSNALVDIETMLPAAAMPAPAPAAAREEIPPNLVLYFCIPSNEKLLGYWDTIADRMFKIRHCMDIEGRVRQLPLFAPPIDPALLVRARAAGLDLGQVINGVLDLQLPHYRFQILMQKALEFCNDVKAFGGALLAALEKKDAEDLSALRTRHEVAMLKLIAQVKHRQIDEARETLEGLKASRKLAEKRLEFYSSREFMNAAETSQVVNLSIAHEFQNVGQGLESAASFSFLIPDTTVGTCVGTTFGGTNIGNMLKAGASVASFIASQFSFAANMSSIIGGYERRKDDWNLQADLATKELQQIDRQILAAEIRLAMAELDKANQEKQTEQAEEVESFLKIKFTNSQLYSWMVSQVSALHFQAYRMAFDLAKKAEKAAQHELGLRGREFDHIQFGHWESQRKGLLAGDRLQQDLRRMELAYLDKNARNYELIKHISLRQLNPVALLRLKATDNCEFTVPEWLFDLDHPGHYMRRIRNVSLSVPAVSGPYTGINCTLSLLKSTLRRSADIGSAYRRAEAEDSRFEDYYGRIQSIVTSSAQNDSGLFDTNLRDERFLPFEGAGAESTWKLELPAEFRRFDYDTISDVILHVRYTAKEGGAALKREATEYLKQLLNPPTDGEQQQRLLLIFSLRHDFASQWHHFASGAGNFVATVRRDYFPYFVQGKRIELRELELYENHELRGSATEGLNLATLTTALQNNNAFDVPLALTVPDGNTPLFLLVKYSVQ